MRRLIVRALLDQYRAAGDRAGADRLCFAGQQPPIAVCIALSLLIVAMIGLYLYRIAFQPLAHTSVLVLLIASVGCHLALQGLGLLFFGAEGQRGPDGADRRLHRGLAALHRPEPRRLRHHHRLHRRALAVLRPDALRQGAARHRRQPAGRAARRHPHHAVGTDRVPAGLRDRRAVGHPDRADHDAVLRHRLPDRPEGLRRRDHRRPRQLSPDGGRGAGGRHRRGVLVLLCLQLQGGHRLHAAHPRAAAAFARRARASRKRRIEPMCRAACRSSLRSLSWRRSRSSRACRRSGSCCSTISASPRWSRWGSCC